MLVICICALAVIVVPIVIPVIVRRNYYKTPYAKATGYSYSYVVRDKGRLGEARLSKQIYNFDPQARAFFNVYIPKSDGSTSKVDAIYIASWGIIVFENKNYAGWIFGKASDFKWTQTINKRTKNYFYNPIKQKESHIKNLSNYLDIPVQSFISFVVFSDNVVFKKVSPGNNIVIQTHQVRDELKLMQSVGKNVFNKAQILQIAKQLDACTHVSSNIVEQHVRDVQAVKL